MSKLEIERIKNSKKRPKKKINEEDVNNKKR